MGIKLNFVPAPKISNSDVKYKGFHPRQKKGYIKLVNDKMKEIHDEFDKELHKIINEQHNKLIYTVSDFYNICKKKLWKIGDFNVEKCISDPIFEGIELVFNSMMKQIKVNFKKISRESNETLDDKEEKANLVYESCLDNSISFCDFLKYLYKTLNSTCSNISDMFRDLLYSTTKYVNETMQNEFGIHRWYLLSYETDIIVEIIPKVLEEKIVPKCRSFFVTNLSSLISACFESYESACKKLSPDTTLKLLKKFTKEKFKNQEKDMEETISSTLTNSVSGYIEGTVKNLIFDKQESKIRQLMPQIGKALDIISQKLNFLPKTKPSTKEQNIAISKIEELKKALSDLSKILASRSGKLKDNQVKLFDEILVGNGSRNKARADYKISNFEMQCLNIDVNEDASTARIIINLFIILTDEPNRVEGIVKFVKNYIDKLMPNAYPTYNCTDLYRQIKEGKKLIKIKLINYLDYQKLLELSNTLDILKRILEGKTPFFSTTFESNITSVFKIDYDQTKIKSNEFAFRAGENLIISQNISIQKLILSFLKKTDNDKNFIVNKIKEQIEFEKQIMEKNNKAISEPKSAKPDTTKPESDKPESTKSRSGKPKSTESRSGKGNRRHKKKETQKGR